MPATLKYSRHLRVMVTQETRERLDRLEAAHPESLSAIVRQALDLGLPAVERRYDRRAVRRRVGASQ